MRRGREEVLAYPTAEIRIGAVEAIRRREDGLFAVAAGDLTPGLQMSLVAVH